MKAPATGASIRKVANIPIFNTQGLLPFIVDSLCHHSRVAPFLSRKPNSRGVPCKSAAARQNQNMAFEAHCSEEFRLQKTVNVLCVTTA